MTAPKLRQNSYRPLNMTGMEQKIVQQRALARLVSAGFVALSFIATLNAQKDPSEPTTICAIASQPERFDGRRVAVHAQLFSDGEHGSMIYDESCGHFGLDLYVSDGAESKKDLEAALNWCHRSTRGKFIAGTFTGTIHFKAGTPPDQRISVERIDGLTVRSTHTTSASFPEPCPDPPALNLR